MGKMLNVLPTLRADAMTGPIKTISMPTRWAITAMIITHALARADFCSPTFALLLARLFEKICIADEVREASAKLAEAFVITKSELVNLFGPFQCNHLTYFHADT